MQLSKGWREFVELLTSNKVEFLVVGAFAVAWHGFARFTADIDLLIRPDPANAELLVKTLRDFGLASLGLSREDLTEPERIVHLGVKPNRIDLITSIAGITFEEAWASRVAGTLDGLPVDVLLTVTTVMSSFCPHSRAASAIVCADCVEMAAVRSKP
jgi:hypothetical protein